MGKFEPRCFYEIVLIKEKAIIVLEEAHSDVQTEKLFYNVWVKSKSAHPPGNPRAFDTR